jgi:hypothetical protein
MKRRKGKNESTAVIACMLFACGVTTGSSQPNLLPYQPPNWSDKIVVSNVSGTSTDTGNLVPADTLYLDWAVLNGGDASINASFTVELYVDDMFRTFWTVSPPTDVGEQVVVEDYNLGSLSWGTHTLRIKSDATNSVTESNEADNEYTKTITLAPVFRATNDDFINRSILTGPESAFPGLFFTNSGATKEAGEPLHDGNVGGASIWYSWTAPASGVATFSARTLTGMALLAESPFDALLAVYTGDAVNSLNVIASNEGTLIRLYGFWSTSVTFNASAGVTYQIAIDGKNGAKGTEVLFWRLAPGPFLTPTITISTSSAVVNEGQSADFTISPSTVNPSEPVTVNYSMSGKAMYGTDYTLSGIFGQITIPPGASTATVTLNALTDNHREKNEKATMTLLAGTGYNLPRNKKASLTIANGTGLR